MKPLKGYLDGDDHKKSAYEEIHNCMAFQHDYIEYVWNHCRDQNMILLHNLGARMQIKDDLLR